MKKIKNKKMSKYQFISNADSAYSIDLSKPEGMSSFWNLFSKNNKKEDLHIVKNNGKAPFKLNSVAMKILKLKGIDLTNIETSDLHSLKQKNKVILINPKHLNLNKKDLFKENILYNLDKQRKTKDEADFELNAVSVKSRAGLVKSSVTYLRSKKPNINAFSSKKGLNQTEKDNRFYKLSSLSETSMFKSIPESKLKKRKRKRVIVPVYVEKEITDKSNGLEEEYYLNFHRQDETFDMSSLIAKIKTMEEQLNNLKCKSKINQSFYFETDNSLPAITRDGTDTYTGPEPRPMQACNRTCEGSMVDEKYAGRLHQNTFPSGDFLKDNPKDREDKINMMTENFVDILNNPDILIKNHNLIIPDNLSEKGLFQANPSAGCDTIMKVFKDLTEKENQPKNNTAKSSKENIHEMSLNTINTNSCILEMLKKISDILPEPNKETNMKAMHKDTRSLGEIQEKTTTPTSDGTPKTNYSEKVSNGFRNIFSLPVDLNTLKLFNHKKECENSNKNFQETELKADTLVESHNNSTVEEQTVCATDLDENELIINSSEENKISSQNIQISVSQTTVDKEMVEHKITNMSDSHKVFEGTSMKNNFDESKPSDDSRLNVITGKLKENSLSHTLNNSSLAFSQVVDNNIPQSSSVDNLAGKCDVNMINLNINHEQCKMAGSSEQPQKLYKKTTISCPVISPNQKVNITIVIDNNKRDEGKIERDSSPSMKTPSLIKLRDIQSSHSSVDLKKEQNILEEDVTGGEKDTHYEGEPCVFQNLKSNPSGSKINITLCNLNSSNHENNKDPELIKPTSKHYLTKEQRKVYNEEILKVEHDETSVNLSNFKFLQRFKNPFPMYGTGLINILSRTRVGSQTTDTIKQHKFNTKHNTNRPIYGSCTHKRIETNPIIEIIQQCHSFNSNSETKKINPQCCDSYNLKTSSLVRNNNEFRDDKHILNHKINSCLSCEGFTGHSDNINLKKRPCRFNLTLNEESLVRQAENHSPFLKLSEDYKTNMFDQHSHNINPCDMGNCIGDTSNGNNEGFNNCNFNCLTLHDIVYKTVTNAQPDFNEKEKCSISSSVCVSNQDISLAKTASSSDENQENNETDMKSESKCSEKQASVWLMKVDVGVQSTFSNHENGNIQQNNFQDKQAFNPEELLSGSVVGNDIVYNSNSSICDTKLISQNLLKRYSSLSLLNETNGESLSKFRENSETINKKATFCRCATLGCLAIPDSNNDDSE